ncbi:MULTISPECIES: hypothetical protein [Streptomyces]|uniref:Uncharacterized protein n=1 Tax=Streptomyces sanyensis TaxID=568869 RepID=A0ABP9A1X9_9ACTN
MTERELCNDEFSYLVQYARMAPLHFTPLWDAAEKIAGPGADEGDVRESALRLISDMIDNGIRVGDMSAREGEGLLPWNLPKEDVLARISSEMQRTDDPLDLVDICWFGVP